MKEKEIKKRYEMLVGHLNEKTRRLWCSNEALSLGRGGVAAVSRATGVSRTTIIEGKKELKGEKKVPEGADAIRRPGGGRKKKKEQYEGLLERLEKLVDPVTRGDPESFLKWVSKSTRHLADALDKEGFKVSHSFVSYTLKDELGYTLQGNKKTKEGADHPDRNAQFEYINAKCKSFADAHSPIISVDTKKKENIGNYKNNGKEYRKKGFPREVKGHDFMDKKLGKVAPYGVYDIVQNKGWVNVGISKDTARFAVNAIRSWWNKMGEKAYPKVKKIYINADGGGSNGYRVRLWKVELQKLATELNLEIHVSHFPPGTSKWNKIEHRMFSFISKNWRGKPLLDRVTVVNLIANTTTKKGLEIKAQLDETIYKTGIKVSDEELAAVKLAPDEFHGEWNYKILPQSD